MTLNATLVYRSLTMPFLSYIFYVLKALSRLQGTTPLCHKTELTTVTGFMLLLTSCRLRINKPARLKLGTALA